MIDDSQEKIILITTLMKKLSILKLDYHGNISMMTTHHLKVISSTKKETLTQSFLLIMEELSSLKETIMV